MPGLVKLLNAVDTSGTSGNPIRVGTAKPPYSIRVQGGAASAGTGGVDIQTSFDGVTYVNDFGDIGGDAVTEAEVAILTGLPDKTTAMIRHQVEYIKAVTGAALSTAVTVYLDFVA